MNSSPSSPRFPRLLGFRLLFAALLGASTGLPPARGQALPPAAPNKSAASPGDEPTIELSPFTIVADKETGWVATQTLAGSRMKTEFKDVAQPIEVMTKDFMDDLALTNYEEAIMYSTNIEGPRIASILAVPPPVPGLATFSPKTTSDPADWAASPARSISSRAACRQTTTISNA